MKKKTVKEKLVDHMLANGNDFRYTEMIAHVLKITKGEDYVYNYKTDDRGYYSTNFCITYNGYMVNGKGSCGVYRNEKGRYSAIYYKKK